MNTIFPLSKTFIKVVKIRFFRKVQLPMKPTGRYCFCLFHRMKKNPKRNHQIASSRAKTRSRQSHTCVRYRDNIVWIRRNTEVNTSDLKIFYKKTSK